MNSLESLLRYWVKRKQRPEKKLSMVLQKFVKFWEIFIMTKQWIGDADVRYPAYVKKSQSEMKQAEDIKRIQPVFM